MTARIAFVAAALASLAAPASADMAFEDLAKGIRLGGSERMMVYALSDKGLPAEARAARERVLTGMGLRGEAGTVTRRNLSYSPILTHDSNINGGYGSSSFTYAGLPFTIDEQYQAVGGLLVGGGVNGTLRIALGSDTALGLSGSVSAAYAPEHDMWKLTAGVSACVTHMFSYGTYGYGCLDANWRKIELGESARYSLRTGVNQLFASGMGLHEVTAELQYSRNESGKDYEQALANLSMTTILSGGYAITLGAQLGEGVEGVNVMRERVFVGTAFELFTRPTSITLGVQSNHGGVFLGEELDNKIYTLGLSHQINEKLTVSVYGSKTKSNVEFYDDNQLGLNVSWRF